MTIRELIGNIWGSTATGIGRMSAWFVVAIALGLAAALSSFDEGIWALSALACGALLGFLFGIPRVQQRRIDPESASDYRQSVNTNMEEISDWLTKIIVGVGLVQLNQIPSKFESLVRFLAGKTHEPGFVGSVVVFFGVSGFLSAYILTRVVLSRVFSEADQAANRFNEEAKELPEPVQGQPPSTATLGESIPVHGGALSPKTAVLTAWAHLYGSARSLLARKTSEGSIPKLASTIIADLRAKGLLDDEHAATFEKLRRMSKLAAMSGEAGISSDAATEFANSAVALSEHCDSQL